MEFILTSEIECPKSAFLKLIIVRFQFVSSMLVGWVSLAAFLGTVEIFLPAKVAQPPPQKNLPVCLC